MKRLTLLRHAKSSWEDPGLRDFERPLARRGQRDAPMMGARLAQRGFAPDLLLTSPAVRAEQTARLVATKLATAELEYRSHENLYHASPGEILSIVASIEDIYDDVLLVGHNPGLTQLANMLLPTLRLANLPTCGVVAIDGESSSWRQFDSATFSLRFYDYPKNKGAIA